MLFHNGRYLFSLFFFFLPPSIDERSTELSRLLPFATANRY